MTHDELREAVAAALVASNEDLVPLLDTDDVDTVIRVVVKACADISVKAIRALAMVKT